jgi:ABC-type phosphate transport system substrate-binding protein
MSVERQRRLDDNFKMRKRSNAAALVSIVLVCAISATAKDIAVISHKGSAMEEIAQSELVKLCKGQTSRWPDGKPVSVVLRDPAAPQMRLVLEKIYGVSKEEVPELITTANHNRVNHPAIIVVDSDEAVVKKVETTPGAIGLVDVYAITGGVTVVRIGGKLPLEPGYLLHGN